MKILKEQYDTVIFNEREIKRVENSLVEPMDRLIRTKIETWSEDMKVEKLMQVKNMQGYCVLFFLMFRVLIPNDFSIDF